MLSLKALWGHSSFGYSPPTLKTFSIDYQAEPRSFTLNLRAKRHPANDVSDLCITLNNSVANNNVGLKIMEGALRDILRNWFGKRHFKTERNVVWTFKNIFSMQKGF